MSCAAVNCTNRHSQGYRMFRFPRDAERQKIWIQNSRRANWTPTHSSVLCEVHFEKNQFEENRLDGWRKLKQTAIPTIFDNVPNLTKTYRKRRHKKNEVQKVHINEDEESLNLLPDSLININANSIAEKNEEIRTLKHNVTFLRTLLDKKSELLQTFLNNDEISILEDEPSIMKRNSENTYP